MRFKEFYKLSLEKNENVLEEGWMNKVNVLLTMALLGVTYSSYKELETQYNNLKKQNPAKVQNAENLAKEIEQRKEEIIQNPEILNDVVKNPEAVISVIKQQENKKPSQPEKQLIAPDKEKAAEIIKNNIKDYIRFHEISNLGIRNKSYADSKGYSTIGIGHLVLKDEIGKLFTKDEISKVRNKKGKLVNVITISDEKAEQIFDRDFNAKWKSASSKFNFPSLAKYPVQLQTAIVDGFFRGDLSSRKKSGQSQARENIRSAMTSFFKYNQAIAEKRTADASKYLDSAKNSLRIASQNYLKHPDMHDIRKDGVDKRMRENAKLISSALENYNSSSKSINPEMTPNF